MDELPVDLPYAGLQTKSFTEPDGIQAFPHGRVTFVRVGDITFERAVSEPGWKWSEHVKPLVGTELCMVPHTLYQISGITHVVMADGQETDIFPREIANIPAGHDAWVVGGEPSVAINITPDSRAQSA
jgi:hypothetical protein